MTVRTSTAGAEGIEGKKGIAFNGGLVDVMTPDDAINANATAKQPKVLIGLSVVKYALILLSLLMAATRLPFASFRPSSP